MFEIREWVSEQKKIRSHGLKTLGQAFKELEVLKKANPDKVYSIYRSKEGRKRNDYYVKEACN